MKFSLTGFPALYKVQIGELHTQALFDTGTSINAISFKFYSTMQRAAQDFTH